MDLELRPVYAYELVSGFGDDAYCFLSLLVLVSILHIPSTAVYTEKRLLCFCAVSTSRRTKRVSFDIEGAVTLPLPHSIFSFV